MDFFQIICDLAGARTQDHLLKREVLYQLSYQVFLVKLACLSVGGCKYTIIKLIFQNENQLNLIKIQNT